MSQPDPVDDLALALFAQNNMLIALIRTHPNRGVLETAFSQAQRQFPEAADWSSRSPTTFNLTRKTIDAFETALTTPLDP